METVIVMVAAVIGVIFAPPVVHWLMQPFIERARIYHFHSSFLFSFPTPDGGFALHFGTLYDFFMKLRHERRGSEPWALVLRRDIAEGIERFGEWLESSGVDPTRRVTMGSHFMNDRKMARLGFIATPTPRHEFANVIFLYWEMVVLQRIFMGRWRHIPIGRWQTYSCSVGDFVANRDRIAAAFGAKGAAVSNPNDGAAVSNGFHLPS